MDKLTDTNRRRRNKSKDFDGSPLSNMFNSTKSDNVLSKTTPTPKQEKNKTDKKEQNVEQKTEKTETVKNDKVNTILNNQDLISKLPKKHNNSSLEIIKNKTNDSFSLNRSVDGKYRLAKNTMYKKVKSIPKTLSMREDLNMILDDIVKKGDTGSYVRGLKSTIVANGIMRELYEIGAISKEDLKRELRPYE